MTPETWSIAWFKDVIGLAQAVLLTVASFVGLWGINRWRVQLIGKRRAEIAEQAVAVFYDAQRVLKWARTPGTLGGEGKTRPRDPDEEPALARRLDAYFIPIERLHKDREVVIRLQTLSPIFRAYFGRDAEQPFTKITSAWNEVLISAEILIEDHTRGEFANAEARKAFYREEQVIGRHSHKPDELAAKIAEAVAEIEATCLPILRGKR